jgi:hypothetical protein
VRENSNFFRDELRKMGCEVLGDEGSPVMPIMLYNPGKIPAFSRECLKRNVCFPIPVLWIKLCLLSTVSTYKALPQLRHPGIAEVLMQLSGLLCH